MIDELIEKYEAKLDSLHNLMAVSDYQNTGVEIADELHQETLNAIIIDLKTMRGNTDEGGSLPH